MLSVITCFPSVTNAFISLFFLDKQKGGELYKHLRHQNKKYRKHAIVTIVERVSKKTILKKVKAKTAALVASSTIKGLEPYMNKVLIITGDNGSEFAYHEKISKQLKANFYFAHPCSSWKRGLNENTNGLVRQYLKKGGDFGSVTDADLLVIADKLNNRPRKALSYQTPNEIFLQGINAERH